MNYGNNQEAGGFQQDFSLNGDGGGGGAAPVKKYLPVTLKQIIEAHHTDGEDVYYIDGHAPSKVTFIAKIKSVNEMSTHSVFKMEDGTGIIDVQLWVSTNETDAEAQQRAMWREDTYVRVVGHLSEFMEKRKVHAAHLAVVEDFNEITFHLLEAMQCHIKNARNNNTGGSQKMNSFNDPYSNNNNNNAGYQAPQFNASQNITHNSNAYGGMAGANVPASTGYGDDSLESPMQRDVLNAIKSSQDTTVGMHVNDIASRFPNYGMDNIKDTLDYLCNEGHIYSTINEDHFLSTDS